MERREEVGNVGRDRVISGGGRNGQCTNGNNVIRRKNQEDNETGKTRDWRRRMKLSEEVREMG